MSAAVPASSKPRRRRWRIWLPILLVLLALPGLFAWWLLDPTTVLSILRQTVRESAGLELDSEQPTRLIVIPAPRLALREVSLHDLQGRQLASIESIDVELPWESLWTRPPPLGRIALSGIDLQSGPVLDDWLALWSQGPPQPSLQWPELARGLSVRRLRYYQPLPTSAPVEEQGSAATEPVTDETSANPSNANGDPALANEPSQSAGDPLFEIDFLDLDPVASGEALRLDLAVLAQGYRLGLNLRGRAEDASGSLRVAAAELAMAFGPIDGDDEAVRIEGTLDVSYLPAGGLRGDAELAIADASWIGAQLGLPLKGPVQIALTLTGEEGYDTDIQAQVTGEGISGSAQWPLGPTAAERLAELRLDYTGADGLRIEGLRLTRDLPGGAAEPAPQ
jgi:hypothetical protein